MPPEPAHTVAIAARQIRYGFGNPLRAGLVDDPWAWPWSTLRDLHGAAFPMWTDLPTTARRLRVAPGSVLRTLTAYADYAVPPLDDALPIVASLSAVRAAVHSALRADPRASLDRPLGRTLAIQTLLALGLPSGQALAAHAQCSTATVRRVRRVRHPALDAVLRCLADPRLAAPFPPPLAITSARRLGSPGHGR